MGRKLVNFTDEEVELLNKKSLYVSKFKYQLDAKDEMMEKINRCLSYLKKEYSEFVYRKLFEPDSYKYWWVDSMYTATYYRLSSDAMRAFIEILGD